MRRLAEASNATAWLDAQVAAILLVRPELGRTYGADYQAQLLADLTARGMDAAEARALVPRLARNAIFHAGVSGTFKARINPRTS